MNRYHAHRPSRWRERPAYLVARYHDEPDKAAVRSETHYPILTLAAAIRWANTHADEYWNGGATIHRGTWTPANPFADEADQWEDDENWTPKYVYQGIVQ